MAKKQVVDNTVETVENVQQDSSAEVIKKSKPKTKAQTNTQLSARTATN